MTAVLRASLNNDPHQDAFQNTIAAEVWAIFATEKKYSYAIQN